MTDFLPTATLVNLRRRAQLLERLRRYFHEQGFWEVETPVLSHDTVIDRYLDPIPVVAPCPSFPSRGSLESAPCWLQTSPEFGMKRLLAAGADAIYQVTRAFRRDENGPLHNPEFTMVEWYRVGHTMKEAIELLGKLCDSLLPFGIPECRSYCEVFEQHLGIQPHRATLDELIAAANRAIISIPESLVRDSIAGTRLHANLRDEWLNLLLAEAIQPHLGITRPTIVYHYPASQAALARIVEEYDRVAERFELYVHGIELANGYHELLDPAVLAERQALANRQRQADGKAVLPENNRLLGAMQHGLPACAGTALGFDRLVMVALGAKRIDEVIAFPFDRA